VAPGRSPSGKAKSAKSDSAVVPVGDDDDDDMSIVEKANAPPLWFAAFEKRMTTQFGDLSTMIEDIKVTAQNAKEESHMALEVAKSNDIVVKELQQEMEEIRKLIKDPVPQNFGNGMQHTPNEDVSENRELEVIAHGFEKDTDAEEVEQILNDFIKEMQLQKRVSKVYTFSDPTSVGVLRFKSIPMKIGFYKQLRNHTAKSKGGSTLRFEDNKTLQERAQDKHLGYTKHLLIDREMVKPESIKIFWRTQHVEIDKVKVAWLSPDGEFHTSGVAVQLKQKVQEMVKDFTDKRQGGSSSD
jgi:hypothetical protein